MNLKASSWASNRCVYTYITWLENFRLPYWLGECNIKTFLPALHNRANLSLSETIESTNFGYTIMGNDDSRGLLNTVLYSSLENDRKGQRPRHRVRRHARPGCGRKHNTDGLGETPPEYLEKVLGALGDYVQYDFDREPDSVSAPAIRQAPVFQPFTSSRLTQGYGAELTPRCAVSKAADGTQHDRVSES